MRQGWSFVLGVCALVIIFAQKSVAQTPLTEDFTDPSRADFSVSTGVYNSVKQVAHAPFKLNGLVESFSVGTGQDGAFDSSTYPAFGLSGGVLVFNTDIKDTYNFTRFDLAGGITLTATGSRPLVIRVIGDCSILGVIDIHGQDGFPSSTNPGFAGQGGTGGIGGGSGGTGGSNASLPGTGLTGGIATLGTVAGGTGGCTTGGVAGGGGGGGHQGVGATVGGGAVGCHTATNGVGGANYPDYNGGTLIFTQLIGGSGGGGGGASLGGGVEQSGAGGGGGGGAIRISCGGLFNTSGNILANGGNGGVPGTKGGGGGGGAGGRIWLQSGDAMTVTAGNWSVLPGTGTVAGVGEQNGAAGQNGLIRINPKAVTITGGTQNPFIGDATFSEFSVAPAVIQSNALDTGVRNPVYNSVATAEVLNGGTVSYQFAGSGDRFASDDSGWVGAAQISQLNGKRWLKYKITLTSGSAASSPQVSKITVNLGADPTRKFGFTVVSCNSFGTPTQASATLLIVVVFWVALRFRIRQKLIPTNPPS